MLSVIYFLKNHKSPVIIILILILILAFQFNTKAVPTFARATGLPCSGCHITFPQLNSFGRQFKLNAYDMIGTDVIESKVEDSVKNSTYLRILKNFPLSAMFQASYTHLNKAEPKKLNNNVSFPQQLSLFLAGSIAPKMGIFLQITYNDLTGAVGWDNTDLRYADNTTVFSTDLTYGFTLNNNPTSQDLWHTNAAWGFPFSSSPVVPTPSSSPLLGGGLAQRAMGLGVYGLWGNLVYTEISAYRSAFQGGAHPEDSTVSGLIKGVAPYWRLAIQKSFDDNYLSVGSFGMAANMIPSGIKGTTNNLTDIAIDAQYEHNFGTDVFSLYATYLMEKQKLDATHGAALSQNAVNKLNSFKLFASYFFAQQFNFSLGYFNTTGTADNVLYTPASLTGSYANKPNSDGLIGEFAFIPWFNTRFSLQYVYYNKFNGGSKNYDGFGRNSMNNNGIYLLAWIMY